MRSPFIRLPLALLFVLPVFVAQGAVWGLARRFGKVPVALLSMFIACVLGWAAYALYTRWVERRGAGEFARAGGLQELGAGLLMGAALFSTVVGVQALFGAWRITGVRDDLAVMMIPLCVSFAAATIEEIVFRGVIFRLLEESLGTWIALAISAALFGLGHLTSPHASTFTALAIALEAGVMLAAAYVLTRRLWLAIGIHAAWNFTQSGIFGVPTSGVPMNGIFIGSLSGPAWLSGGAFGAEASVVAVALCTALGLGLLWLAHRRGHFIAPFWRRSGAAPATAR
ncbi:MAG: type II CAAX endopeptidase family protein [Pseudomonadota bacterium]